METIHRILLVDDDPTFTSMLRLRLEATRRFSVSEVNDPAAALDAVHRIGPAVVILDVIMPGLDGGDVASQLAADPAASGIPTIFLTGLVEDRETPGTGLVSGHHRFLSKSSDSSRLVECIDELLGGQDKAKRN